ncbi:MAG: FMN-binding protein [Clostridiaceae bacterium]
MIIGILTAVLFALVSAVYFTRRMPAGSPVKRAAHVIHKPLGYALVALILLHLVITLKLFYQRPLAIYLLGFGILACVVICLLSNTLFKTARKGLLIHRIAALCMALMLIAHVIVCITSFNEYKREVAAITIEQTDVSALADGTYEGDCDVGYIYARVRVKVTGGKIAVIDLLEHRNERGAAGEGVLERIVAEQRVGVDAVSSATNSSRVIEKAVANALNKPPVD